MNVLNYRDRMGKFILFSNIFLFLLILILYGCKGFTEEELTELLKYLVPIKSIYLTAVVKFVIDQRNQAPSPGHSHFLVLPLYKTVTRSLIYAHISILYCLIIFSALNIITFDFLINAIVIIESAFGVYIGLIVADMFKTGSEQVN
jgi:hypothetical protein